VPVLYCGGLLYYFLDLSGSVHEVETNGLGPTVLGLGAIGLLFCIPLIVKIVRIFIGPRSPGGGRDVSTGEREFDADATLARYLAKRSAEVDLGSSAAPPAHDGGEPQVRRSFGRKIRE